MVETPLELMTMTGFLKKIQSHKVEILILLLILAATIFLRFFRISEYMTFLGDEGRDALIVKRILTQGDIPFIGPPSSVGNVYLGPLYYYLMALSMSVFWLNPVASAGMVAMIGSLTVFLIYYFGRLLFNNWTGLVAASLYAISPITINYSRSSWNPNPAPFFAILTFISLYKAHLVSSRTWLFWCGVFLSGAVQMHYLTLPMLPAVLIFWITKCYFQKLSKSYLLTSILALGLGFNLTLLPWWLFELKHDFMNLRGIKEIFLGTQSSVGFNLFTYLEKTFHTSLHLLIGDYLTGNNFLISLLVLILVVVILFLGLKKGLKINFFWQYLLLFSWLIISLVLTNLYKGNIYDHYIGYITPALYLIFASTILWLGKLSHPFKIKSTSLFFLMIVILVIINVLKSPLQYPPNRQLQSTQDISKFVINQAEGKPFNFALIAERNYDAAYQFYLGIYGHKPAVAPIEITDQLFIVCEDKICQPINNSKYEIAAFGMIKEEKVTDVSGVKVYKMIPNPSGQK